MSQSIDEIIDGVFSPEEFENLNSLINADIQTLKQYGSILFKTKEENGLITETLTFTAFLDPTKTFTRVYSYHKTDNMYKVIQSLNKKLEQAIDREDYISAAKIKHQKEELLFNKTI